jgi:hypothetical protein
VIYLLHSGHSSSLATFSHHFCFESSSFSCFFSSRGYDKDYVTCASFQKQLMVCLCYVWYRRQLPRRSFQSCDSSTSMTLIAHLMHRCAWANPTLGRFFEILGKCFRSASLKNWLSINVRDNREHKCAHFLFYWFPQCRHRCRNRFSPSTTMSA